MTGASSTDQLATTAPFYLSSYDVDRLMRDDSPTARVEIMHKVAVRFRAEQFQDHELAVAEQIFRLMMKDVALEVRKELSQQIMDMPNAPRDVVLHLAQDVDEVALPVIEMSQVLSDADLVFLVNSSRQVSKLMAVTRRETVSERVSSAVVDTRYPEAVESLLANPKALIANDAMQMVIDEFSREGRVMDKLAARDNLPMHLVEKLISVTSARMAESLKAKYPVEESRIRQIEEKVREESTLKMLEGVASDDEIDTMVSEMVAEHRLAPSLVFSALCRGQLTFFVFALARLAHIPRNNAIRLVSDAGGTGFNALYHKAGLPETMLEASHAVLRSVLELKQQDEPPATTAYGNKLAQLLLIAAEEHEIANLPFMLALIRNRR